MELLKQQWSW